MMLTYRRAIVSAVLTFLLVPLLYVAAPVASAEEGSRITGTTYAAPSRVYKKSTGNELKWGVIEFEEDLFISEDILLPGVNSYRRVDFSVPRNWEVQKGSKIEVHMCHSPTLFAQLSAIVFVLNGRVLFTTKLDETNVNTVIYNLDIPTDLLKEFNSLEIMGYAHNGILECEDPFDPSLWSRVHRTSKIHIRYKEKAPYVDLAAYPFPIFERFGYEKTNIIYSLPSEPSPSTLTSIARFQVGLGRTMSWKKAEYITDVDAVAKPENHVVMIGTPKENAAIRELANLPEDKALPLPLISDTGFEAKFTTPDGKPIFGEDGVIIFTTHPNNPSLALLILTGNSEVGVAKAVAAISELPYDKSITGQALIVKKIDPRPIIEDQRTKTKHIPKDSEFTLADIEFEDVTVRGFFATTIGIDLIMEPDSHPIVAQQKMKLVYSYSAQLQNKLSSMEIVLNGISINSKYLDKKEGESRAELVVDLPVDLLRPVNKVYVRFFLYPESYIHCGRVSDRHLWATVHKETQLTMPRYYWVYLPDLAFLKYEWFPYTLYQDLHDTSIVVEDNLDSNDYRALLTVSAELGRVTESEGIYIKAFQLSNLPETVKSEDHLIVIDSTPKYSVVKNLVGDTRLFYNDQDELVFRTMEDEEMKTLEFKSAGLIEQINSPFNPNKTMLLIRGQFKSELDLALDALTDSRKLSKLEHNISFSFDNDKIKATQTSEKQLIGELPAREETQTWIYLNFWQTVLYILLLIIVIYIVVSLVRYWRQRKKEKKKQEALRRAARK